MRRIIAPLIGCAACCMWGVSICLAPSLASRPTEEPSLAGEITRLRRAVLDDPLDSKTGAELIELRQSRQRQRRQALHGLIEGLQGYLEGKRATVRPGLAKAMQSPYAVSLARAILAPVSLSLNQILEENKRALGPEACTVCGDTGLADCRKCSATGIKRCPSCKGTGHQRSRSDQAGRSPGPASPCEQCKGKGAVPCPECNGRGAIQCRKCAAKAAREAAGAARPAPHEAGAVSKLIGVARYLRDGGIDLYSPDALKCSPKLTK